MYSGVTIGTYAYIPTSELRTPVSQLKRTLTAKPRYSNLANIKMYDDSRPGYFGIPRHFYRNWNSFDTPFFELVGGRDTEFYVLSELRSYQVPLYEEFLLKLERGVIGFILKARTGSGKTVLLLKFIERIAKSTLVIVPTTALLLQWKEMIMEHTSLTERDIGHVQADRCDYIGKPISIGMIHSVCKDKYGEAFKQYFGNIVCDELHKTGAEHFSKVVSMFPAKYRIGGSATLKRPDGMDKVFRNHLGETVISLTSEREEEVRPRVIVVGYEGGATELPHWYENIETIRKRGVIISALARDNKRSDLLLTYIIQLAMSGRRVLVLSDRIKQLKYMRARTVPSHKAGMYINKTPDDLKKKVLAEAGIIYATYGMFAIGQDVPDLSGLVFATPQGRIRQPVGRVSRVLEGKLRPTIIDVVDLDIDECKTWYKRRLKEYSHPDILGEVVVL